MTALAPALPVRRRRRVRYGVIALALYVLLFLGFIAAPIVSVVVVSCGLSADASDGPPSSQPFAQSTFWSSPRFAMSAQPPRATVKAVLTAKARTWRTLIE